MSEFLSEMEQLSRLRTEVLEKSFGVAALEDRATKAVPATRLQFDRSGFDLIGEAKLASPADGRLVDVSGPETASRLAKAIESGGASAVSVLTEESRFEGSLSHLETIAARSGLPVMRKDFLTSPIQVLEARAAGASGVLLIARILDQKRLSEMTDLALTFGMFVLVELFDSSDLEVATAVFDREVLVGVNSRDLETLAVQRQRFAEMAPALPFHLPKVAESGIDSPAEVVEIADLGYDMALVGSAVARSAQPEAMIQSLLSAGRSAKAKA